MSLQTETAPIWVNYLSILEDVPSMISVDTTWLDRLGHDEAETLLTLSVTMKLVAEDEIVSRKELPRLQELAEALAEELPAEYGSLVARSYGSGAMHLYIYTTVPDEVLLLLEPLLEEADYESSSFEIQDPDWSFYAENLYPSPVVWQNINNDALLVQLKDHGDDGATPRPIQHRAHFPDDTLAREFAGQLDEMGYEVVEFGEGENEERPVAVIFEREDAPAEINEITGALLILSQELGGAYDGWGTHVVAG